MSVSLLFRAGRKVDLKDIAEAIAKYGPKYLRHLQSFWGWHQSTETPQEPDKGADLAVHAFISLSLGSFLWWVYTQGSPITLDQLEVFFAWIIGTLVILSVIVFGIARLLGTRASFVAAASVVLRSYPPAVLFAAIAMVAVSIVLNPFFAEKDVCPFWWGWIAGVVLLFVLFSAVFAREVSAGTKQRPPVIAADHSWRRGVLVLAIMSLTAVSFLLYLVHEDQMIRFEDQCVRHLHLHGASVRTSARASLHNVRESGDL
jgi:hypothetical protein